MAGSSSASKFRQSARGVIYQGDKTYFQRQHLGCICCRNLPRREGVLLQRIQLIVVRPQGQGRLYTVVSTSINTETKYAPGRAFQQIPHDIAARLPCTTPTSRTFDRNPAATYGQPGKIHQTLVSRLTCSGHRRQRTFAGRLHPRRRRHHHHRGTRVPGVRAMVPMSSLCPSE